MTHGNGTSSVPILNSIDIGSGTSAIGSDSKWTWYLIRDLQKL